LHVICNVDPSPTSRLGEGRVDANPLGIRWIYAKAMGVVAAAIGQPSLDAILKVSNRTLGLQPVLDAVQRTRESLMGLDSSYELKATPIGAALYKVVNHGEFFLQAPLQKGTLGMRNGFERNIGERGLEARFSVDRRRVPQGGKGYSREGNKRHQQNQQT